MSLVVSTHVPSQETPASGPEQVPLPLLHVPAVHVASGTAPPWVQSFPHVPQFSGSVSSSVQPELQQAGAPPSVQPMPQPPQLALSESMSVQVESQQPA